MTYLLFFHFVLILMTVEKNVKIKSLNQRKLTKLPLQMYREQTEEWI